MGNDCKSFCTVCKVACLLVVIGAINWGLVGLGNFLGGDWNVVAMLLGGFPALENIVYILVGVAGVMKLCGNKCPCRKQSGGAPPPAV